MVKNLLLGLVCLGVIYLVGSIFMDFAFDGLTSITDAMMYNDIN